MSIIDPQTIDELIERLKAHRPVIYYRDSGGERDKVATHPSMMWDYGKASAVIWAGGYVVHPDDLAKLREMFPQFRFVHMDAFDPQLQGPKIEEQAP